MEVNFSRRMSAFVAIFGMLLLLSTSLLAQSTLGRISGVVTDPSGAVVPNAKITATNDGTKQDLITTSSNSGSFNFAQVPVGVYTVKIEAAGLKTGSYTQVKVDTGLEYSLTAKLEVGAASETVEVVAGADLINTTTSEISNTVNKEQIRDLPLISRNPLSLVTLQAGVPGIADRANSAINGARPGWTQVTQDGINVNDNYIRTNSLDFVPNRPTADNVGEFTISTNNLGADQAGGSSQVKFTTEAGTNAFHGSLFEFNRNNYFAANDWANNNTTRTTTTPCTASPDCPLGFVRVHEPTKKPYQNRNQYGGRIGGPILKDKLFFFGYYERYWEVRQRSSSRSIPLYDSLLSGEFRFKGTDGVNRSVNVLTLAGLTATAPDGKTVPSRTIDSTVSSLILPSFPSASGVTSTGASLLAGTQLFNQSDQVKRTFYGGRMDWSLAQNHGLEFTYKHSSDQDQRTDIDNFNINPLAYTLSTTDFYVAAWRWTINPRMQNEVRVGGNLAPVAFLNDTEFGSAIFGGIPAGLTNPVINFQPQGRDVRTFQYTDNFSWIKGNHNWAFGGSLQRVKAGTFFDSAAAPQKFPLYNFGYSTNPTLCPTVGTSCEFLRTANFVGLNFNPADLAAANGLRAFLSGMLSSAAQGFEVKDKTAGYVPGQINRRNYTVDTLDFYAMNNWRVLPNLTLNLGLKWEYWSPLKERDDLTLVPTFKGSVAETLLDPAAVLDFSKGTLYKRDMNNFAPSVGFAWDPFKDGKTSLRGGYTLTYVNDEIIRTSENATIGNPGLSTSFNQIGLAQFVSAGTPNLTPPAYKVPRTLADQIAVNSGAAFFVIDPDLKTPYVHQLNLGVQRELPGDLAVEARYVGTIAHKLFRGFDNNQTKGAIIPSFLAEFNRARQNLFSSCNAIVGATCPNAASTMPTIVGFGLTTNNLVTTPIRENQIGALADLYVFNRAFFPTAPALFLSNPAIYVADGIINGGDSNYHALQIEARRRMKQGVFGQINYTWGKTLTNAAFNAQTRFDPLLDNARPGLEKRISDGSVRHVINANMIYELPFGQGKRWANNNNIVNYLVGGWQTGNILHWQSGATVSIVSARGSFNRAGRSGLNTAFSNLSRGQIQSLFGIFRCGENGVTCPGNTPTGTMFFINPSVTTTTGRAVGADNLANTASTTFNQIFLNPVAGQVGNLGINAFSGPQQFQWDFSVAKKTKITERFNVEFRSEFFNVLNHTNWFVGASQNINATNFGRLLPGNVNGSDGSDHRVIQFALKLNF